MRVHSYRSKENSVPTGCQPALLRQWIGSNLFTNIYLSLSKFYNKSFNIILFQIFSVKTRWMRRKIYFLKKVVPISLNKWKINWIFIHILLLFVNFIENTVFTSSYKIFFYCSTTALDSLSNTQHSLTFWNFVLQFSENWSRK